MQSKDSPFVGGACEPGWSTEQYTFLNDRSHSPVAPGNGLLRNSCNCEPRRREGERYMSLPLFTDIRQVVLYVVLVMVEGDGVDRLVERGGWKRGARDSPH